MDAEATEKATVRCGRQGMDTLQVCGRPTVKRKSKIINAQAKAERGLLWCPQQQWLRDDEMGERVRSRSKLLLAAGVEVRSYDMCKSVLSLTLCSDRQKTSSRWDWTGV